MTLLDLFHSWGFWATLWFIGLVLVQVWNGRDTAFLIKNVGYMVKSQTAAPYVYLLALIVWPITIVAYAIWMFWPED